MITYNHYNSSLLVVLHSISIFTWIFFFSLLVVEPKAFHVLYGCKYSNT